MPAKNNIFEKVKLAKPPRSVFDLSHEVKMSLNPGGLYPCLTMECVPGDSFKISHEMLVRSQQMLAPLMHRIDVTVHTFFVPNRLVWSGWEDFITQQPFDGTPPTAPLINITSGLLNAGERKYASYFGIPEDIFSIQKTGGIDLNAIPFAAFNKIYNEYYRDQNLIEEIFCDLEDGDNSGNIEELIRQEPLKRAWNHDYFTAALPWAQKGNAVEIPLGEVSLIPFTSSGGKFVLNSNLTTGNTGDVTQGGVPPNVGIEIGGNPHTYDPNGTLGVEATTINDLRRAFRLQEWYERQARGGTRYIESILAHFGIRSSDARLQRPEYITGVKAPVTISEVLSTNDGAGGELGQMGGHGLAVTAGNAGRFFCEEHGWIISVMSIMPRTAYMNGIPKSYLKHADPMEYYWPEFANIGEQEISKLELFASADDTDLETPFGYIPRYAEYKYMCDRVAGDFMITLSYWHQARQFSGTPELNQLFIDCDPRYDIWPVASASEDHYYADIWHSIRAVRPMPFYGTPSF